MDGVSRSQTWSRTSTARQADLARPAYRLGRTGCAMLDSTALGTLHELTMRAGPSS